MEYSIQLNAVNNPEKSVRAFATLVFGDSFKVTNVAVLEGSKGNFVSMPSFRTKERDEHNNPVYKDVCNPITKEFREELYNDILKLYDEMEQTGKAEVKMEAEEPDEPEFTVRVTPFEREGSKGNFVSMPSFRTKERDEHNNLVYKDVCNPITKEFREELYSDILKLYDEMEQTGKAEVKMEAEEPDEPEFTVRVTLFECEGSNMVGLASIVLNDSFAVGNVSVVEGRNGMFVAMPSYKAGNRYRDVCFPITKEFREKLNDAVLETYQQAKEQAVQEGKERASQQMQTDDRGFMKASGEPLPFR